jgi:poly(3-hydroxybutyrate) depolymerase
VKVRAGGSAHRRGAATALLAVLALAACTGGSPDRGRAQQPSPAAPAPPAGSSLQFAVATAPIDCQAPAGAAGPCRVGGSAVAGRLGKLRLYHQVRLGPRGDDGCAADYDVFLDGRTVSGMRWSGCRGGAEVVAYRIVAEVHAAPRTIAGQPVASLVWGFLSAHRR